MPLHLTIDALTSARMASGMTSRARQADTVITG